MATEILGFLIIVGILIVFIVRRDLWNGTSNKADEVEEASVKMRLQMEHSANAIITQMDSRIHQLEGLVAAADERACILEQQMAAVRADQERAQQQAEKAFAEMRAAQASYYTPQEEPAMPPYRNSMQENPWAARDEYRARVAASERSLRPVEGVSSVRRPAYASRVRMEGHGIGPDFAETLSASMYAAEAGSGAYRGAQPMHYGNGQSPVYEQPYPRNERYPHDVVYSSEEAYDARGYEGDYAKSYPAEAYPEEGPVTWEQYVEQPRRPASSQGNPGMRRTQTTPVEMAVEETPAVIVESKMMPREDGYAQEEPDDEGPAFSPEQLEELARTEAEVVVSSSVADVVDLPMAPNAAEESYDDAEDEDIHAFADTDAGNSGSIVLASPEGKSKPSDENDLPESEAAQEDGKQPRQSEVQDMFEEEGSSKFLSVEDESLAASTGESTETAGKVPDGTDTLKKIPVENAGGGEPFARDEQTWETQGMVSLEAPVADEEEVLADGTGDTPDEGDFEPRSTTGESRKDDVGPRPPSPTIRARELLASGMSPEEVAKETGMGRSAVELLAQMTQGKLNSQDND